MDVTYVLSLALPAMAATSAPSSLPQVDFSRMGSVGMGGAFSGLDWWSDSSSFASSSSSSARFSSTGDTLMTKASDGSFTPLGSTNSGGVINAICWSNSSTNGTLYIGGSFTSLGSVTSTNIASYDISSAAFKEMPGLSGPAEAVYCDNANGQIWVGGLFTGPSGVGENVGLWSVSSSSWVAVPFGGLNGVVDTISPSANGSSIYFGGTFTTLFSSNSTTNSTSNMTSIQSAPANTQTTGDSGYLTPVTMPSYSSTGNLSITAIPSTDQSQFSDPNVMLCPGSGTWLAQDNTISDIDILGQSYWRAAGVRITNAQVEGRGATSFCVTALPDDVQLNMTYTDPATGKTETCWEHCPLYTNSSISAQDFLFTAGVQNMTGLQMQLKTWIGDGAGLSSVQVLSEGSYASAASQGNTGTCSSQQSSSSQTVGEWTTEYVSTNLPATTAYYLQSKVPVGDSTRPQVTFYPYVSAAGYYDVYVVIPGCDATEHCEARTTVDIEVFPEQDGLGWTSTISEQVHSDAKTLVYSGWIDATTSDFSPTVLLALAQSPSAPSSGDTYYVIAEAVELRLTGTSETGPNGTTTTSSSNTTQITNSSTQSAFGVYEYVRSSTVNAAATLANASETALTQLGFGLSSAKNASSATSWTVNTFATLSGTTYVGGDFAASGNYSNIIAIDIATGKASALASQGLNGVVYASAVIDNYLYLGGEFTAPAAGGVTLNNLARYDTRASAWAAVGGGVNGVVTQLAANDSLLAVIGNFSQVIASDSSTTETGGYAVWDSSSSSWSSSDIIFGNVTVSTTSDSSTYLAGRVSGTSQNSANGVAMLSTGDDGSAEITSLTGASFSDTGSASTSKRSFISALRRSVSAQLQALETRFVRPVIRAQTAPTITETPSPAPAVLAGAFWTNSSASGKPTVSILGGNFTSSSGSVEGVGFYANSQLTGTEPPVTGTVRALSVMNDVLYVGGTAITVSEVGSSILAYDLAKAAWKSNSIPAVNPSSGASNVSVNAIQQRLKTNTLVVAGDFATAGSLNCAAVCLWDTSSAQWNTPGTGLQSGEVKAIDFAGTQLESLFVAGSFVMPSGSVAYAALYSFTNSSWTSLDGLPGPALAIASDDRNATNVFAAGYSTADDSPYLQQWNGQTWTAQNASLLPGSVIQQLAFVPMTVEHAAQGSVEKDRMLMLTGELSLSQGNMTSALYDGATFYPYLVGISSSGGLGSASQLFWSSNSFSFAIHHYLARGLVVLVAMAIATGLVLLLILLYAIDTQIYEKRYARRDEPDLVQIKNNELQSYWDGSAPLKKTIAAPAAAGGLGAGYLASVHAALKGSLGIRDEEAESKVMVDGGSSDEDSDDEDWRETTMRYDFEADPEHPGELSMRAGQRVEVNERLDSNEWWYARDPASGREGIVPQTYVW